MRSVHLRPLRLLPHPFLFTPASSPQVLRRTNRQGYKAGAMVEAMDAVKGQGYE